MFQPKDLTCVFFICAVKKMELPPYMPMFLNRQPLTGTSRFMISWRCRYHRSQKFDESIISHLDGAMMSLTYKKSWYHHVDTYM